MLFLRVSCAAPPPPLLDPCQGCVSRWGARQPGQSGISCPRLPHLHAPLRLLGVCSQSHAVCTRLQWLLHRQRCPFPICKCACCPWALHALIKKICPGEPVAPTPWCRPPGASISCSTRYPSQRRQDMYPAVPRKILCVFALGLLALEQTPPGRGSRSSFAHREHTWSMPPSPVFLSPKIAPLILPLFHGVLAEK